MERWNGRVALVTGASSGIGASICRVLVKHGLTVVGCARSVSKIEDMAEDEDVKLAPGKLFAVKCDLTKEADILALFDYIRHKFGRIDICVNNAGFSTNSPLLTGETNDWRSMIEVNVLALCICTRESVKLMRENGINNGQIINICSTWGHTMPSIPGCSGFNFYCGTKFMVRAITEGLRMEVKSTNANIRVASISPGPVETNFMENYLGDSEGAKACYSSFKALNPGDIADAVICVLQSPPHVDVNDIIVNPVAKIL